MFTQLTEVSSPKITFPLTVPVLFALKVITLVFVLTEPTVAPAATIASAELYAKHLRNRSIDAIVAIYLILVIMDCRCHGYCHCHRPRCDRASLALVMLIAIVAFTPVVSAFEAILYENNYL